MRPPKYTACLPGLAAQLLHKRVSGAPGLGSPGRKSAGRPPLRRAGAPLQHVPGRARAIPYPFPGRAGRAPWTPSTWPPSAQASTRQLAELASSAPPGGRAATSSWCTW